MSGNYFNTHLQALCLPFLSLKLTHNEAHGTQCWFNYTDVWVPSRASAAAEPSISALCAGEQHQGLSVDTPDESGVHSAETVKEGSGLRDISEGTELTYYIKGSISDQNDLT